MYRLLLPLVAIRLLICICCSTVMLGVKAQSNNGQILVNHPSMQSIILGNELFQLVADEEERKRELLRARREEIGALLMEVQDAEKKLEDKKAFQSIFKYLEI